MSRRRTIIGTLLLLVWVPATGAAQARPERARDLGIPLEGTPGPLDAITDVPGVAVGHATVIRGSDVRTGVTAVFPRGTGNLAPVFAGWFNLNGNGEMTGTAWIDDYGLLLYPIAITNTNSVGVVRDAVIEWGHSRITEVFNCCLPVVAETSTTSTAFTSPRRTPSRPSPARAADRWRRGTWAAAPACSVWASRAGSAPRAGG
jgi:L-aminopeptidase/D-esterase-like protein